jgi:ATP-dependent Clp protease, protease subunit
MNMQIGNEELTETVYLTFFAGFRPETARALLQVASQCANAGVKEVHLLLGTPGGGVDAGLTVYNVLKGMPFHLVTHNTGNVASIGVAVYLAGEERLTSKHSSFLLHGVSHQTEDGAHGAKWFREQHDGLLASEAKINAVLAERTKLTVKQLARFSEVEQTKDEKTAVDDGIAHRIEDVVIPDDALVHTVAID